MSSGIWAALVLSQSFVAGRKGKCCKDPLSPELPRANAHPGNDAGGPDRGRRTGRHPLNASHPAGP